MQELKTAAFFRAEGTIFGQGVLSASAYMAANARNFGDRLFRLGQVAMAAPVYGILGQNSRTLANRVAHLSYRNTTEDRIICIGEEYFDEVLKNKILDRGVELMKQARDEGHVVVLLSEGLSNIMQPLADHLEVVDHLVCNRLDVRNGVATGKLLEPVIGGHDCGRWVREFAQKEHIDLTRSVAYAAHGPDLLLLAAVGEPCVVNPDFTLRRAAQEADWPVVEYRV